VLDIILVVMGSYGRRLICYWTIKNGSGCNNGCEVRAIIWCSVLVKCFT
jgi:hypothetical protein